MRGSIQAPTVYTTTNPHGDAESARATRIPLPMDARNGDLLRLQGAYGSLKQSGSGAPAVWEVRGPGMERARFSNVRTSFVCPCRSPSLLLHGRVVFEEETRHQFTTPDSTINRNRPDRTTV